jgi:hypothetical protein
MSSTETPVAEAPPAAPTLLNSPLAVGFATLLCGPVSGFWLLSYNDGRLKRRGNGWLIALVGAVWVVFYSYSLYLLSSDVLACGLILLNLVLIQSLAFSLHGKAYRDQRARGESAAPRSDTIKRVLFGLFIFICIYYTPYALHEPDPAPVPVELWDLGDDPK